MHPVAMDPGRAKKIGGSPGFPELWQTSLTGKGFTNEMNERPWITHLELVNGMGMNSQIK
jgi:predicted metal-dependent phosphotriesterase family hydrolase